MRAIASTVLVVALAACSAARADAVVPSCPHAQPANADRCELPSSMACTYGSGSGRTLCACRDGRWSCAPMPPAPHS